LPTIHFSKVVFPQPEGPKKLTEEKTSKIICKEDLGQVTLQIKVKLKTSSNTVFGVKANIFLKF